MRGPKTELELGPISGTGIFEKKNILGVKKKNLKLRLLGIGIFENNFFSEKSLESRLFGTRIET